MKRLLLVLDDTPITEPSLNLALDLAQGLKASLSVLHVTDPILKETDGYIPHVGKADVAMLSGGRDRLLSEALRLALEADVRCRPLIANGDVTEAIMGEVGETDLVIIGREGPGTTLAYGMSGPITESFLRHAPVPVIMAGPEFHGFGRILVAFDGMPSSTKALNNAVQLVGGWRGDLIIPRILCVGDKDETQEMAARASEIVTSHRVEMAILEETGKPEEVITRMVDEKSIDLLAMGVYGREGLRQKLFGSVTEHVLSNVNCSILVCH